MKKGNNGGAEQHGESEKVRVRVVKIFFNLRMHASFHLCYGAAGRTYGGGERSTLHLGLHLGFLKPDANPIMSKA